MATYTKVFKEKCISCGACAVSAPEIFEYDENGVAQSILDNNKGVTAVSEDLIDDLEDAEFGCPTEAISVQEDPFENN